MPRKITWVDRQQRRHDSRFFRLLDGSFLFRLSLAASGALALLLVVNSYATCRNNRWAQGCLWRDAEALISVGNVESLSIVTAAFLYVLEGHKRRQRDNLEAFELLNTCNASGVPWLIGRIHALEILNSAGLPLDGQQLAGYDLHNLQAPHGHWHGVNLQNTVLRNANLAGTDLTGSNLRGADLRGADLRGAILDQVNLEGALLEGAQVDATALQAARHSRQPGTATHPLNRPE
ncbi:MAG: pentapeptide repeat-containing protein [Synechococcaceae cyanobacterium]|nr:pentapeptide repeat-containing protein [Synechococcaceae cyanobacterium]